jgi:hypothetical protein
MQPKPVRAQGVRGGHASGKRVKEGSYGGFQSMAKPSSDPFDIHNPWGTDLFWDRVDDLDHQEQTECPLHAMQHPQRLQEDFDGVFPDDVKRVIKGHGCDGNLQRFVSSPLRILNTCVRSSRVSFLMRDSSVGRNTLFFISLLSARSMSFRIQNGKTDIQVPSWRCLSRPRCMEDEGRES